MQSWQFIRYRRLAAFFRWPLSPVVSPVIGAVQEVNGAYSDRALGNSPTALHIVFEIGRTYALIRDHARSDRRLRGADHAEGRAVRRKAATGNDRITLAHARFLAFLKPDIEFLGGIEQGQLITDDKTALLYGAEAAPVGIDGKKHL